MLHDDFEQGRIERPPLPRIPELPPFGSIWLSSDSTELAVEVRGPDRSEVFIIQIHLGEFGPEPQMVEAHVDPSVLDSGWTPLR
jgi:hypothetical protein